MNNNNEEKIFYRTTPECFELFEYIKYIEHCVSNLKGIVQNDMIIDNFQTNEWKESIHSISKNLILLEHKSSLIFKKIDNPDLIQKLIDDDGEQRILRRENYKNLEKELNDFEYRKSCNCGIDKPY